MMIGSPAGSPGGAADEAGGAYRRGVAAFFVAHGLNGLPVENLPASGSGAIVEGVALETGFPVDDVLVQLRAGRLYVQAKRSLRFGRPMEEVASQWLRAVRDPGFTSATDWIAAAAGEITGSIRALATALRRRQSGATAFSPGETGALTHLRRILQREGATPSEEEIVLAHAVVLHLQVEEAGEEHFERGRLLLDGHVVAKGQGTAAWRELLFVAGEAARLRLGLSIAAWLDALRKRETVNLTADAAASRSADLARREQVKMRYRQHVREAGERVDLTPLGLPMSPVPLEEMDADIPVLRPQNGDRESGDLLWMFRRRGRVLLTGLPGGGKSTIISATAASWANREGWALPIVVSLGKIAGRERFRMKPLRDQLIEAACEALPAADRPLLASVLDECLANGNAVLFLDGLDEAADRSILLASDIARLLQEIHPDTDVLLATRDVAYAHARILGFDHLRLGSPKDPSRPVKTVLRAIAEQRAIAKPEVWVASRLEWVKQLIASNSTLSETPLLPVLLASLAADQELENLPQTRSLILAQVIENVVRRGEARREIRVSGLPQAHEVEAILGTFTSIAIALSRAGGFIPRAELVAPVARCLESEWGLPRGVANATASQILTFWDESGIFVAGDAEKVVAPRLRLFMEMGAALHAASRPEDEATEWVESVSERPDFSETLVLAAGRSRAIMDALIERACQLTVPDDERLLLTAAQAMAQGATASERAERLLISRLTGLLQLGDAEAWKAFRYLAVLDVPGDMQHALLDEVRNRFPPEHDTIARAHASFSWGWDRDRLNEYLERALRVPELPRLSRRVPTTGIDLDEISDRLFMQVTESAAATLLPTRPDLAPLVAEALGRVSLATFGKLASLLREHGHEALAKAAESDAFGSRDLVGEMVREAERSRTYVVEFLETLAAFPAPATLDLGQQRRLRELASLVETLNLNDPSAWFRPASYRSLMSQFIRIVATLGGFDEAVLASQAAIVKRELVTDPDGPYQAFFSLFAVAPEAELTHWDRISDVEDARAVLIRVLRTPYGSAVVAASALVSHPDRERTAALIESVLEELPHRSVTAATWANLTLVDEEDQAVDRLARSDSAGVREAIARLVRMTDVGRPTPLARRLASDPVRQVRLAVLEELKEATDDASPELEKLLESMASADDTAFDCHWCGKRNPATTDSCVSCHIVIGRPSAEAARLLELTHRRGSRAVVRVDEPRDVLEG